MMGYAFRALLALGIIGWAGPAMAQGFVQARGEGRVIASFLWSDSNRGFDDNGDVIDIPNYEKTELYLAAEYGLTDDLTLLFTPSFRSVTVEGGSDSTGLGYTDIGARYRVAQGEVFSVSLQGLVRIPGKRRRDVLAQVGSTDAEYDLRVQGAHSFGAGSFIILEGGYRLRAGEPPDEFRADATLGVRATPRLLLLANSYNVISNGRGRGVFDARLRYHNVFLSAAYDVTRNVTVQAGVSGTVAGRNALRERGLLAGVWYRF